MYMQYILIFEWCQISIKIETLYTSNTESGLSPMFPFETPSQFVLQTDIMCKLYLHSYPCFGLSTTGPYKDHLDFGKIRTKYGEFQMDPRPNFFKDQKLEKACFHILDTDFKRL